MSKIKTTLLKESYLNTFKGIQSELTRCRLNIVFRKQIEHDIFDMLLSAQEDNVEVERIVGSDIVIFCDDIVETYLSIMTPSKKLLDISFWLLLNFTAFSLLDMLLFDGSGLEAIILSIVSLLSDILSNHIHKKYSDFITRRYMYITSRLGILFILIIVAHILCSIFNIELFIFDTSTSLILLTSSASLSLLCYLMMRKAFGEKVLNY